MLRFASAAGGYRLTVRHGSRVRREEFEDLDEAIASMERLAAEVRAEGPLGTAKAIRDYGPQMRVAARLELSAGGWLRGREAGRRARLPRGAEPPIRIYINGVEQSQGSDYEISGGEIVFGRPIVKEGKV